MNAIELDPEHACPWHLKGETHLRISLQEFNKSNYGNALDNLKSALDAFDTFSNLFEGTDRVKEDINKALTAFLG